MLRVFEKRGLNFVVALRIILKMYIPPEWRLLGGECLLETAIVIQRKDLMRTQFPRTERRCDG